MARKVHQVAEPHEDGYLHEESIVLQKLAHLDPPR